jgi:hypothetical protein
LLIQHSVDFFEALLAASDQIGIGKAVGVLDIYLLDLAHLASRIV